MTNNSGSTDSLAIWRAKWLALKGYVFDTITNLPTVAMILEDICKLLDEGKKIGVIYIDMSEEDRLEEMYGWEVYDGLLVQLVSTLKKMSSGGVILSPDDLITVESVRSDKFVIFVMGESMRNQVAPNALEGLAEELVRYLRKEIKIQVGNEEPRGPNLCVGTKWIKWDPTVRTERSVYKAIEEARSRSQREKQEHLSLMMRELKNIIATRSIRIKYQPIVWIDSREIFGYEALSGGVGSNIFSNPEFLFSFAERSGVILDLERLCGCEALKGSRNFLNDKKLFINFSVYALSEGKKFVAPMMEIAARVNIPPSNIVLEITERVAVKHWHTFRAKLDELRNIGFKIAVDDMGSGYSSLQSIVELSPNFLKYDMALVRNIHKNQIKQDLLASLVKLAEGIGSKVIAEGIELEEEYETIKQLGVTFGQGFLFSPPNTLRVYKP